MNTPHKHAEVIKAWADGATIQVRGLCSDPWEDIKSPSWWVGNEYRVKPIAHKWQHLIDAQAAGKAVQMRSGNTWHDGWWVFNSPNAEYRLKPETIRVRVGLTRGGAFGNPPTVVVIHSDGADSDAAALERDPSFDRWLTDWVEVEV